MKKRIPSPTWLVLLTLTLSITLLTVLGAQPPKPTPAALPTLSDALKLKFFKAQSELMQASEAAKQSAQTAQQKQATFQAIVTELQGVCGATNQLELDKEGNPVCVVKAPGAEKSK